MTSITQKEIVKNSLFNKLRILYAKNEDKDFLNIDIKEAMCATFFEDGVEVSEIEFNPSLFQLFCKVSSNYLEDTRSLYHYIEYMGNNFNYDYPKQHYIHIYFFNIDIMKEILQQMINIVDDKMILLSFKNMCNPKSEDYNLTLMIPIHRPKDCIGCARVGLGDLNRNSDQCGLCCELKEIFASTSGFCGEENYIQLDTPNNKKMK